MGLRTTTNKDLLHQDPLGERYKLSGPNIILKGILYFLILIVEDLRSPIKMICCKAFVRIEKNLGTFLKKENFSSCTKIEVKI